MYQEAQEYCRERLGGGDGAKATAEPESHLYMQERESCGFWEARSRVATGSLTEVLKEGRVSGVSECAHNCTRLLSSLGG